MNDLTPYTHPPLPEIAKLSPIQKWAIDILVQGLRNRTSATTNVLTTAYGGLATMADTGLAIAMRKFLAVIDPYRQEPLYANDPFEWGIEGRHGFAGTISNISEATVVGTNGLQVYNVAVMPYPSSTKGVWYDNNGNPAGEDYGDTLRGFVHLDPLLLVHIDPDFNSALLDLQRVVACDLLEIARPIVRTDVVCHSSTFGRLWEYSGPIGLLQETPPPFNTLPGGDIYLSDGLRYTIGGRSFLGIANPGDTGTNLQRLDQLVKQLIGNHLTTDTVVEELVPQGLFGGLLGRTEWRTTIIPNPMARLQSSCAQLQDGLLDLGIDPITAAAAASSWLIGMKCAARNVGINA